MAAFGPPGVSSSTEKLRPNSGCRPSTVRKFAVTSAEGIRSGGTLLTVGKETL
jgi:hypothetical protein